MDPATKAFLNSLKCPICRQPIDIYDGNKLRPSRRINFSCAADYRHYAINLHISENLIPPFITEEIVNIIDNHKQYEIWQLHGSSIHHTNIQVFDLNGDGEILDGFKQFLFEKQLFDFQNTNKQKILNRVKTILVFQ